MRHTRTISFGAVLLLLTLSLVLLMPAQAGEVLLSVNSGTENDVFFIEGEPSLVMNGFDLTPIDVLRPALIDRVTIAVDTPVPGQTAELVIYEDTNGGSPVDATLVGRQTVTIESAGSVTLTLNQPVTINAPVVWIGFYLPVGFRFLADQSGSSVLTYWAWTPGGTFDLANLSSAQVFGPADGSAPVGVDLNGKARITAEISSADPLLGTPVVLQSFQTIGNPDTAEMGVLAAYESCPSVQHDTADEFISYGDRINVHCFPIETYLAPPSPAGFSRREGLYDVVVFTEFGGEAVSLVDLEVFVTHCITPVGDDVNYAVIGVAYGAPRVWRILPTERYGTMVCAEVPRSGNLSYFVPSSIPVSLATPEVTAQP